MSSDAPLAGTAADAPLSAAAPAAPALPRQPCANCGAEVTLRFCGACGQRLEPPLHTLWHFAHVATEDLTHADSRLWRTLAALLFRPGFLTAEFLAGRRARYLPPLRLYLVVSVLFFLLASAMQPKFAVIQFDDDKGTTYKAVPLEKGADVPGVAPPEGKTTEARAEHACEDARYSGPAERWLAPAVPGVCRKVVVDWLTGGHQLREAFLHNVPRAMFLFLPLLAAVMMLMYWRPRHYYVEHLLLFLHNHALVFMVIGMVLVWSNVGLRIPGLGFAIFLYLVWYMYRSMRVVYRQGWLRTLSKLTVLSLFYLAFAMALLAITTVYSALTL
jgi:hypothetical protein